MLKPSNALLTPTSIITTASTSAAATSSRSVSAASPSTTWTTTTLLCYIHQNPVKAGIVASVKDYAYSNWHEYSREVFPQAQICHVEAVLRRLPFEELSELVNTPLPEKMGIIDIDDEVVRHRLSEEQVKQLLAMYSQTSNATEFQQLGRPHQSEIINLLRKQGASIRQLERLTGLSRGLISRL